MIKHVFRRTDIDRSLRTGEIVRAICGTAKAVSEIKPEMVTAMPGCKRCDAVRKRIGIEEPPVYTPSIGGLAAYAEQISSFEWINYEEIR